MKVCIVAKCLESACGIEAGKFSEGKTYYFDYVVKDKNYCSVTTFDDIISNKTTRHKREFFEGVETITLRGTTFKILSVKQVPDNFNFELGMYNIQDVLSNYDLAEFRRIVANRRKGGMTNKEATRVKQLYKKYENKLKLEV